MPRAHGDGKGIVEKKVRRKVNGRTVTEARLFVRVRYTGPDGKRRAKWKRVATRTEAKERLQELAAEVRGREESAAELGRKTFGDLATHFCASSLVPAQYRDGRKVSGRRMLRGLHSHVAAFCRFFGARPVEDKEHAWAGGAILSSITHARLDALRRELLASPVGVTDASPAGRPRSITSVNRQLALLRNMLNVAARAGWLKGNPFALGPSLISAADEAKRTRLLSYDEEDRLLAECVDRTEPRPGKPPRNVRRAHLRAVVICALDTGMRLGEILKLTWADLDVMTGGGRRRLTIQQLNTKTLQERGAPVSKRLLAEFERLRAALPSKPGDLVFGITSNVKRSFAGACHDAGIKDLRFHDLRRTAATRLHRGGMEIGEVSRILGHSDPKTTYRYIGVDEETISAAADIFDRIEEERRAERKRKMMGAA